MTVNDVAITFTANGINYYYSISGVNWGLWYLFHLWDECVLLLLENTGNNCQSTPLIARYYHFVALKALTNAPRSRFTKRRMKNECMIQVEVDSFSTQCGQCDSCRLSLHRLRHSVFRFALSSSSENVFIETMIYVLYSFDAERNSMHFELGKVNEGRT